MSYPRRLTIVAAALSLAGVATLPAQKAPNACGLLAEADANKHIARGKPTYGLSPEATLMAGGSASICDYPAGGQIGIWVGPYSSQNFEGFLKAWKADKATRHPVSGVGDRAWIMFPVPENKYKDRVAYLVAHVGQQIVTVHLVAHDGNADGPLGEMCRGDQSKLKPDEKKDCKKVLADTSETQESLQPAVIELAKIVVANVRAGKGMK